MPDKKMNLHKELAMGIKGAEKEASGGKQKAKYKKGGKVKCPHCGKVDCSCKGMKK